jgi:hypothetical protein
MQAALQSRFRQRSFQADPLLTKIFGKKIRKMLSE